jgi:hypothetical protein
MLKYLPIYSSFEYLMPMSKDFKKMKRNFGKKYGSEGEERFWKYVNAHGLDETKPRAGQSFENVKKRESDFVELTMPVPKEVAGRKEEPWLDVDDIIKELEELVVDLDKIFKDYYK